MGRPPYKEVRVNEILDNGRYTVVGYVVDFDPNAGEGRIDDGTAVMRFVLDNFMFAEELEVGNFVRVSGRVYLSSEGRIMRVELAKRLGVDAGLYRSIREVERRVVTC